MAGLVVWTSSPTVSPSVPTVQAPVRFRALGYSPFGFFLAVSDGTPCDVRSGRARRMSNGEQATPTCRGFVR
ncbi:hypothetical protein FMEAI12_4640025 [Parafrankia sp. Ea1.12]|nr:hypothetical protein FMEAI12_4640025 [Parafrankia sp. Ea1.12]